jgi:exopolyphosphatase/guanosine-5'-triphosphate,3'-diphosphate pyrophosphatase
MNVTMTARAEDWGPFGRPLFDDPTIRRLSRVGVVDVGSNSVRLVIFDGAARSPAYFYNEKVMCGLGKGLSETGRLNPEGRVRALDAIRRFQALADGMGLAPLSAVATAAVREAEDGQEFQDEVTRDTGLKLYVIDGREEARLSAQGVLLGWPQADGLVCDIGGSSMELAVVSRGAVQKRETSALGPLKLRDITGGRKAMRAFIDGELDMLRDSLGDMPKLLFLVGGSWRAIAKIDMARRHYPLKVLHEYRMRPSDLRTTLQWIGDTDPAAIKAMSGVSGSRIALVPYAAEVLSAVLRKIKPREIAVSSYGLREGLLYEQMPQQLRDRDPLIEACRFSEHKDSRVPGFGKVLFRFIRPIYSRTPGSRLRLIRAACLLHDVSWRSHPDYRGDVCFDYATRANFSGLSHPERLFLGLSLMHRYKSTRSKGRLDELVDLMDPEDVKHAEILGRAMRFGAMFTAQKAEHMGTLRWHPNKKRLVLSIGPQAMALYGEVAQARFASLAKALGAETEVVALRRAQADTDPD